ncbi:MAG: hypothetical protein ACK56F_15495 [bacterium]
MAGCGLCAVVPGGHWARASMHACVVGGYVVFPVVRRTAGKAAMQRERDMQSARVHARQRTRLLCAVCGTWLDVLAAVKGCCGAGPCGRCGVAAT